LPYFDQNDEKRGTAPISRLFTNYEPQMHANERGFELRGPEWRADGPRPQQLRVPNSIQKEHGPPNHMLTTETVRGPPLKTAMNPGWSFFFG
jgi:hypothetical protein